MAQEQYKDISKAISRDRDWPELEEELLLNHRQILEITASAIRTGDLIIYDRMIWEVRGEILESVIRQNGTLLISLIDQLLLVMDDGQAPAFWKSLGRNIRASRRAIQIVTERLLPFSVRLADFGACMRAWLDRYDGAEEEVLQHFADTLLTSDLPPAVQHLQGLLQSNTKTPRILNEDLLPAYDWIGDAMRPIAGAAPIRNAPSKDLKPSLARRADLKLKAYIRAKIPNDCCDDSKQIAFIRSLYDAGHYWTCELAIQWYRPKGFKEIQASWPPILQAMLLRHQHPNRPVEAAVLATWPIFGQMIRFGRTQVKHPVLAQMDNDTLGISLDVDNLLRKHLGSSEPVDVALAFVHLAMGLSLSAARRCLPDPVLLAARRTTGDRKPANHLLTKYLIQEILVRWADMRLGHLNYSIAL